MVGFLAALATHAKHKRALSLRVWRAATLSAIASMVFVLNKLGVGSSIHSFAASASLQRTCGHFATIVVLIATIWPMRLLPAGLVFTLLLGVYVLFLQLSGLKAACVLVVFFMRAAGQNALLVVVHMLLLCCVGSLLTINATALSYSTVLPTIDSVSAFRFSGGVCRLSTNGAALWRGS